MYFNPIVAMIHNQAAGTFHPVVFAESPLPGPSTDGKPIRHKSFGHHTAGFTDRDQALKNIQEELVPKLQPYAIGNIGLHVDPTEEFAWDGEGVPALVHFFGGREQVPL